MASAGSLSPSKYPEFVKQDPSSSNGNQLKEVADETFDRPGAEAIVSAGSNVTATN